MENRLKRLEAEDARAQRNQKMAEKKAQEMLQARSRHYTDLMDKIKHYEQKNQELEMQRMKNQMEQKNRRNAIGKNRQ